MKKNKKNLIVFVLLVVVAIGIGTYVYKEYNRKIVNVAETKADYSLLSTELITQLSNGQQYFDSLYHSKILEVSGEVKVIDKDDKGLHTIVIGNSTSTSTIRCSLDSLQNTKIAEYQHIKALTIKGIYTGFNADDMGIGSDVILSHCIIIKH